MSYPPIRSFPVLFSSIILGLAGHFMVMQWLVIEKVPDNQVVILTLAAEFSNINAAPNLVTDEAAIAESKPTPQKVEATEEIEQAEQQQTNMSKPAVNTEKSSTQLVEHVVEKTDESFLEKPVEPDSTSNQITKAEPEQLNENTENNVTSDPSSQKSLAQATQVGDEQYSDYYQALVAHLRRYKKYPLQARRRNLEGVVTLQVIIHYTGTATSVDVIDSSGYPILDDAARKSVFAANPLLPIPEDYHLDSYTFIVKLAYALDDK